ncbi:unnamed protein product, partial [Prunus brigantina]
NLVGTLEELQKIADYIKCKFEMKDIGKTKYCLSLQIEHSASGILVHQSTYTKKVLKRFGMDKAHPLSTLMVVQSLDTKKDPYLPKRDDEMVLSPEVPYLSAIGYLFDQHKGRSQTRYVFICGGTAISWHSIKQTLVATSSNHSEILALHEASHEYVWLRSVIHYIRSTCALPSAIETPTILNEHNATCIA